MPTLNLSRWLGGARSLDCLVAGSEYMHFNDSVNENEIGADQLATEAGRVFSDGEISTVGAFNIEGHVGYKDTQPAQGVTLRWLS